MRRGEKMNPSEAMRILGISASDGPEDVKRAYRKKASETHPDKGGSADEFVRVQAAYEALKDGVPKGNAQRPPSGVKVSWGDFWSRGDPVPPRHQNSRNTWRHTGEPDCPCVACREERSRESAFDSAARIIREQMRRKYGATPEDIARAVRQASRSRGRDEEFMEVLKAMSKWNEAQFQSKVITALESVGCMVFNIHGSMMQSSGWPDLWIGSPHWTGFLELKVDGRRLEDLQRLKIQGMHERRVNAFVLRLTNDDEKIALEWPEKKWIVRFSKESWGPEKGQARGRLLLKALKDATEKVTRPEGESASGGSQ